MSIKFDLAGGDLAGGEAPPLYDILPPERVREMFVRADALLEDPGIELRGDEAARALFRAAGARVEGERVRFPRGLAGEIVRATAPRGFLQHARNPARSVAFGGGRPVFAPVYGSPFVRETGGRRRYARMADFRAVARLAQVAPQLAHAGGMYCEPSDTPSLVRHLDMLDTLVRESDKPFMGSIRNPTQVRDSLAVARIVFGEAALEERCCLLSLFNVESPLVIAGPILEGIRLTAAANQACLIASYAMLGMTAPVTLAGALALMLAEVQAGAALTQLVRPGAPVMVGIFGIPFSMTSMRPTFGTPESHTLVMAGAQLARALGLPFRADGGVTSSKVADSQALGDSGLAVRVAAASGSDFVLHSAGWLENGLTLSFEKFAADLAAIELVMSDASGPDSALAAYRAPGPADVDALLAAHVPPPLPPDVDEELRRFVAGRKDALIQAAG